MHQVKNGGKGSNQTMERILLESTLVQIYRSTQATIQKNFLHTHLTTQHADPDMTKTFANLASKLAVHSPHTFVSGRKSRHEVIDLMDKGRTMLSKAEESDDNEVGNESSRAELDDVLVELVG